MERSFENVWGTPIDPDKRGRHKTMSSAVSAALKDLLTERNTFYDTVVTAWPRLFPTLPARPGCWRDGWLVLEVAKSTTLYMLRPKLPAIKRELAKLPGAPARLNVKLEIRVPSRVR